MNPLHIPSVAPLKRLLVMLPAIPQLGIFPRRLCVMQYLLTVIRVADGVDFRFLEDVVLDEFDKSFLRRRGPAIVIVK